MIPSAATFAQHQQRLSLKVAFDEFNRLSRQLQQSYEDLQQRSGELNLAWLQPPTFGNNQHRSLSSRIEVLLATLPVAHCSVLVLEPVEDLRDLVWAPAQLTFANDAATVALLPVRYAGTPLDGLGDNGALALSRRTEWLELSPGQYRGVGQRTLTSDGAEFGLLELRQLSFSPHP